MQAVIRIHPTDNVAVALRELQAGEVVELEGAALQVLSAIPRGHKLALQPLAARASIIKYGLPIGHAREPIAAGEHVHQHNIVTNLRELDKYRYLV